MSKPKRARAITCKENIDPDDVYFREPKQKKSKASSSNRFASPLSEAEIAKYGQGPVVPNTVKSTNWAVRVFTEWCLERNKKESEKCPVNLLESKPTAQLLNKWLARFVLEARRADGSPYLSSSIYQILCGLLRHARSHWKDCPNFLDKQNTAFTELRGTCDRLARELRQEGVGAKVKHAPIITPEEEELLWESAAIRIYSPEVLVRCIFYYVGKVFCLRGGQEQRDLKPSQFIREYNPNRYTYVENGSKNHKGKFGSSSHENKVVTIYENPDITPPKCLIFLLDYYFRKFPKPPETLDFFYLRPLKPKNLMIHGSKLHPLAAIPWSRRCVRKPVLLRGRQITV